MMQRIISVCVLLGLSSAVSHAAMQWQPAPPAPQGAAAAQQGHGGHGGHRGGKVMQLLEGEGAEAEIWLPTTVRRPLQLDSTGRVTVGGTGVDNYHLLFAKKRTAQSEEVAMRYLYQHGKPSGESPSSLIDYSKARLDILPAPLTREHQRYLSQQPFHFVVRFDGEVLPQQSVVLTTSNGSEVEGRTDADGRVTFHLPDDFTDVQPGRRSNPPADFVLRVAHVAQGEQYHTTLSAPYYVNPSHWRSTGGGLAAMLAGVVTGFVVLRRSRRDGTDKGRA